MPEIDPAFPSTKPLGYYGLSAVIELITPEVAKAYLDRNLNNRPQDRAWVKRLATMIQRDDWQLSPQCVCFDREGHLIDGQHRLSAVVEAGRPVLMMVIRGFEPSVFHVLDYGKKRGGRDLFEMKGEKQGAALSAALRALHLYYTKGSAPWSGGDSLVPPTQLLSLLDQHPMMRDATKIGQDIYKGSGLNRTAAAVGHYLTNRDRPDVNHKEWLEGLMTGAELGRHDPRIALRATTSMENGRRGVRTAQWHLCMYLVAWNDWAIGKPRKIFKQVSGYVMPSVTQEPASSVYGAAK